MNRTGWLATWITIASASFAFLLWVWKQREAVACWWHLRFIKKRHVIGVRAVHRDRGQAIQKRMEELHGSSEVCVMNMKGYSLLNELSLKDTPVHQLLQNAKGPSLRFLLHSPDSRAFVVREQELNLRYGARNSIAEYGENLRKLQLLADEFPGRCQTNVFELPVPLWNMVVWDQGMLVGWYGNESSAQSWCIELTSESVLGQQFRKYYESIWSDASLRADDFSRLRSVFPTYRSIQEIAGTEDRLTLVYPDPPSRENAPLVLIGGGAGSGKSTLAWRISARLGIRNIISTDMVREILRNEGSGADVLRAETWESWQHLPPGHDKDLYGGIVLQADAVLAGMTQMIGWCLEKGMPTIIEGIHVVADEWLARLAQRERNVILFVDASDEQLSDNYENRCRATHMRGPDERMNRDRDRRRLHRDIISRAEQAGYHIIRGDTWPEIENSAVEYVLAQLTKP